MRVGVYETASLNYRSIKLFTVCQPSTYIIRRLHFRCSNSSQVGKVCVENCQQFDGFRIAYRLEVPEKNVSADLLSCHSAVSIAQAPDEMWGLLYVNDTEELRRPECQDLQYLVVVKEQHTQLETSMQIQIILDNEGEFIYSEAPPFVVSCP